MEFYTPIIIFVVLLVLFSLCGWCCRQNRTQGTVFSTPPVIVQTTHQIPGPDAQRAHYPVQSYQTSQTPYPVTVAPYPLGGPQGMPHPQPPGPGFYHTNTTPYPSTISGPPIPQTHYPPQAPYPPHGGYHAPDAQPPSYAEATTTTVTTEVYSKQSPYNPNY